MSGEQAAWVRSRRGLVKLSPHIFGRIDRLSLALATVQLLGMPQPVMEAVEAANDYVAELGRQRNPELIGRWPSIRQNLIDVSGLVDQKHRPWWRSLRSGHATASRDQARLGGYQ
jgi:hypothetical protein